MSLDELFFGPEQGDGVIVISGAAILFKTAWVIVNDIAQARAWISNPY
ncbi:hypothetical protein D777_03317 [Marinobacter nitratireducens]|uniref:Uncharacterized protein n=1 Tax=Marinobacter nitratireducens TaxID=1137280 RepID=A0A072MY33_9GAMM|nr:hypothetical protein D777_03317 [Marinobacter nitratireducens]